MSTCSPQPHEGQLKIGHEAWFQFHPHYAYYPLFRPSNPNQRVSGFNDDEPPPYYALAYNNTSQTHLN
jgi:hypothetical protein